MVQILMGPEKPYMLLPELPKRRVITSMNPGNLQSTLELVTRTSHATELVDTTQSQPKGAWPLHQVRKCATLATRACVRDSHRWWVLNSDCATGLQWPHGLVV